MEPSRGQEAFQEWAAMEAFPVSDPEDHVLGRMAQYFLPVLHTFLAILEFRVFLPGRTNLERDQREAHVAVDLVRET